MSEKPISVEDLKETIVFQTVHKREAVMAFVPERFEAFCGALTAPWWLTLCLRR